MAITVVPTTMHPTLLFIDADEARAQSTARILTLADFRLFVATTPAQALRRILQEHLVPQALVFGQVDRGSQSTIGRLVERLNQRQGRTLPLIPLPSSTPRTIPLIAKQYSPFFYIVSNANALPILEAIWRILPATRIDFEVSERSLVLSLLPTVGLPPRVTKDQRSLNSHFRQMLTTAHELIGAEQWGTLISDVGLAEYRSPNSWPPDNSERDIPAEYLSCLHQAIAFSSPDDPEGQLRLWSEHGTQESFAKHSISIFTQHMLKFIPKERLMSATLNAFVHTMNEIRGENLHAWKQWSDGSYWVVHYSNLYAYARTHRVKPSCQVWIASLEATLRYVDLDKTWQVNEVECSCQTQTGHCLFVIQPRIVHKK